MTDHIEPRSRRAVLAAALAGAGAAVATALGRPVATHAATGDNVVLGQSNQAAALTTIRNITGDAVRGSSQAGIGVRGTSRDGAGVDGTSHAGNGVDGWSEFGIGVAGRTDYGIGVVASGGSYGGTALDVRGHARFAWSGVATIPAGETSVVFDVGQGEDPNVYAESFVLLSPKVELGGRDLWYRTNPGAGRFSIHISTPRATATEVGWLLLP